MRHPLPQRVVHEEALRRRQKGLREGTWGEEWGGGGGACEAAPCRCGWCANRRSVASKKGLRGKTRELVRVMSRSGLNRTSCPGLVRDKFSPPDKFSPVAGEARTCPDRRARGNLLLCAHRHATCCGIYPGACTRNARHTRPTPTPAAHQHATSTDAVVSDAVV